MSEVAVQPNLPEPAPLFPEQHRAFDVVVMYVAQPGGPIDPRVVPSIRRDLEAMEEPVLYVAFTVDGVRRTTLLYMEALRQRGLPTDYESLSQMFPALRWSAR